ncbi:MAG TPA: site-2 protease family protein [Chloroflexota bacterium]|nr:site-2 protease family protein [Chloroflexota bacterium]
MLGLSTSLAGIAITLVAFVLSISAHEFSHALAAYAQGDDTAQRQGRLTLNPVRHLDPLGTLMLLIMAAGGFGLGWGKPTPVNPAALRGGRASMALVSVAGIAANLALAFAFGLVIRDHWLEQLVQGRELGLGTAQLLLAFVETMIAVNIGLALFNLLPIAPLDGFGVLVNLLPAGASARFAQATRWGPGLLMLIIFLPRFIPGLQNLNLLGMVIDPPFRFLERAVLGGA